MDEIDIIIPIKSKSNRIENKNFRLLNGKPLFRYTLDYALNLPTINRVILCTDKSINDLSDLKDERLIIFDRPDWTTKDNASNLELIKFWTEATNPRVRNICLLQPTHPYRKLLDFEAGFKKFSVQKKLTVGTFESKVHIVSPNGSGAISKNLQISGQYYFFNLDKIDFSKKFLEQDFEYFTLNKNHIEINIDNEADWISAEYFCKKYEYFNL